MGIAPRSSLLIPRVSATLAPAWNSHMARRMARLLGPTAAVGAAAVPLRSAIPSANNLPAPHAPENNMAHVRRIDLLALHKAVPLTGTASLYCFSVGC